MTKLEYANKVAEILGADVNEVEKANGVRQIGIIPKEGTVRPTVYVDECYKNETPVEQAAESVRKLLEQKMPQFDLSILETFESVKPHLQARLYNKKTNAEVFMSAEKYGFDDLIIVPYILFSENAGSKVTSELLKKWGVDAQTVIDASMENGDYEIMPMAEMLMAMGFPIDKEMEIAPMAVITNKSKMYGAFGAVALQEKLAEMYPDGYVVIPSSVHEMLVVEKRLAEMGLGDMIREVNESCVDPAEVLGEHEYVF